MKHSSGDRSIINVIHATPEIFDAEILHSELPVVVEVYSGSCSKCDKLSRIAETLAVEFEGAIQFAEVDLAESPQLNDYFEIGDLPALVMVDHAKHQGEFLGEFGEDEIRSHLQKWLATHTTTNIN